MCRFRSLEATDSTEGTSDLVQGRSLFMTSRKTWTLERDFRELDSLAGCRDCLSLRRGDGDRMHASFREGSGLCQAGHELTSASRWIAMAESEQDGRITVVDSE